MLIKRDNIIYYISSLFIYPHYLVGDKDKIWYYMYICYNMIHIIIHIHIICVILFVFYELN